MAIFPGAVATDSDLYIAVNMLSTQLTDNPLTIGATTVNVVDASLFPSVGFLSIDLEIIKYTGKTATSFTGCTRGADGTSASAHVQNQQVFHNVIAAHHNVLKDEIKAIETALGVNPSFLPLSGGTVTGVITVPVGSVSAPSITFTGFPTTGLYSRSSGYLDFTVGGVLTFEITPAGLDSLLPMTVEGKFAGKGTGTNDNAAAGYIGESMESVVTFASRVSSTGTGQQVDMTSLALTAGDWDVEVLVALTANSATVIVAQVGLSTNSGDNGAGLSFGDNAFVSTLPSGAAGTNDATTSFKKRISLASTTTHYAKFFMTYSAATPQAYGYIRATRIR
jgi:hypothetical protein